MLQLTGPQKWCPAAACCRMQGICCWAGFVLRGSTVCFAASLLLIEVPPYCMLQEAERLFGVARPGSMRSQEQAGPTISDTGGQPGVADLLGVAEGLPGSEDGEETTAMATDSESDGTGALMAMPKS